ncbi:Cu(I)-responsive transcriptional regulator [Luteimonas sp. FCS-9]|uniref:Cu(I)-responsive transcriptional regulator n=1 Tax=Luteimonas sp. FCS-9 TaxID=1547516 RepID=UPI00063E7044|nr:Cu(I)-responsive transcriptional regulator [Luteimonas sp. FCS-9]KLI99249.1 transcriptional regulator [Luteimonas sp. FCS-9]
MNIGDAARASGVSAKMIRYYEQTGLIPAAVRTAAGYRAYTQADIHRLHFVRRARDLGFSVAEIADLLGLWHDTARHSADVKHLAQDRIAELERRMRDLQQMTATLRTLVDCCAGDDRPDCPILEELQQPDAGPADDAPRTGAVVRRTRLTVTKTPGATRTRAR